MINPKTGQNRQFCSKLYCIPHPKYIFRLEYKEKVSRFGLLRFELCCAVEKIICAKVVVRGLQPWKSEIFKIFFRKCLSFKDKSSPKPSNWMDFNVFLLIHTIISFTGFWGFGVNTIWFMGQYLKIINLIWIHNLSKKICTWIKKILLC